MPSALEFADRVQTHVVIRTLPVGEPIAPAPNSQIERYDDHHLYTAPHFSHLPPVRAHPVGSLANTGADAHRRIYYGRLQALIDSLIEHRALEELNRHVRVLTNAVIIFDNSSLDLCALFDKYLIPAARIKQTVRHRHILHIRGNSFQVPKHHDRV